MPQTSVNRVDLSVRAPSHPQWLKHSGAFGLLLQIRYGSSAKPSTIPTPFSKLPLTPYTIPGFNTLVPRIFGDHILTFITEGHPTLFNSLRQSMHLLSHIAYSQQGIARFNWNMDRTIISMDGHPIDVNSFETAVHRTLQQLTDKMHTVFRGCNYLDMLQHIREAQDPSVAGREKWFSDKISEDRPGYSFMSEQSNGLLAHRGRLLEHLTEDPTFWAYVDGKLVPNTGLSLSQLQSLS